jgi:plastocyanin
MKLKKFLVPALILLTFALVACGDSGDSNSTEGSDSADSAAAEPSGNAPAPSGEAARAAKVKIVEFTYGPDPVTVQAGGKVIWQNEDTAPHTATADDGSFDTDTIERGKLGSATFKQAGTYPYFCEIHPTMHGTVEVVEKD